MQEVFELDQKDTTKLFCKYCKKSYGIRPCDLDHHLSRPKHIEAKNKNTQKLISDFSAGKAIARAEIMWAFLTVVRNISFNFSEYASLYFPSMFMDSKTAEKMIINRQKTKKIIEDVILKTIRADVISQMKQLFSISVDSSRDISNCNEIIIAAHYFDVKIKRMRHIVYEVLEQNQTKVPQIFNSIKKQLEYDHIPFTSILSFTSDNANEMVGSKEGLIAHFKAHNNSIYNHGCACHKINLILINLFKWVEIEERNDSEWLPEDLSDIWDVREFSNSISSYFNYSYKRFDDYVCFSKKFIEEKKDSKSSYL